MELTLSMFLIVCPLAFLAGVVDATDGDLITPLNPVLKSEF